MNTSLPSKHLDEAEDLLAFLGSSFTIRERIKTLALFSVVEITFIKAQFTAVAHLIHTPSNTLAQQHCFRWMTAFLQYSGLTL